MRISTTRNNIRIIKEAISACFAHKALALGRASHEIASFLFFAVLLFVEGITADKFSHKACGRNFVVHVCLVNEVKHLNY